MSYSKITPDSITSNQMIIDMSKYNGRVNIAEPSQDATFKMFERIALKNKSTTYCDALAGTIENNMLSQTYFSAGNIQIIQNGLRAGVYAKSKGKFVVPPQDIEMLKIIMRSIYLQYGEFCPNGITKEVARLNGLVLDYAIPNVYNEAMGYLKYSQDASTLVVPLDMPLNHDRAYKQLEFKPYFL